MDSNDTELYINNILVEPDGAATIIHVTGSEHILSTVRAPYFSHPLPLNCCSFGGFYYYY